MESIAIISLELRRISSLLQIGVRSRRAALGIHSHRDACTDRPAASHVTDRCILLVNNGNFHAIITTEIYIINGAPRVRCTRPRRVTYIECVSSRCSPPPRRHCRCTAHTTRFSTRRVRLGQVRLGVSPFFFTISDRRIAERRRIFHHYQSEEKKKKIEVQEKCA